MQWLNNIVDELISRQPDGEVVVASGVSPSGTYHVGTLREVLTADAVVLELKHRGHPAKHLHIVDDLDVFRKVPADVPEKYSQYLGIPLCDIPAPNGSASSYAEYFLNDFLQAAEKIHLEMDVIRSNEKYRNGFMASAIEKILGSIGEVRKILVEVSGRQLGEEWSPIQVNEDGYLKKRELLRIDVSKQEVVYKDTAGQEQTINYSQGGVKLDWRLDWPARWWLLKVDCEPFGRDHATKGGSYDTGSEIAKRIFEVEPPLPVPYNFINRVGETKKMSKSAGNSIAISELAQFLPPEVIRFFALQYPPDKLLFFNEVDGVIKLIDEFAELLAKNNKSTSDLQLLRLCTAGVDSIVSSVPFSHLVASYQASLKDPQKTLDIIARTEHAGTVDSQREIIIKELKFIDNWLKNWAPEEVKFELAEHIESNRFNDTQRQFLKQLAVKIADAPEEANGEWFHQAIYELKDNYELPPKDLFATLYQVLIGKDSGPRAGWFMSILPRDWLVKRLKLEA